MFSQIRFLAVVVFGIVTFASTTPATSQDALDSTVSVLDLVEECDILAAHPLDPQRMAEGVEDDRIVPGLAIPACQTAIDQSPDAPRFKFQLGRALLTINDEEAALEQFREAAALEYAAAHAYLGDAYQFGFGVEIDEARARAAYEKALDEGFLAAETQLNMLSFDPSMYAVPVLGDVFEGGFDPSHSFSSEFGPEADYQIRNYLFNFITQLNDECGAILDASIMSAIFWYRYPQQGYVAEQDAKIAVAVMGSVAEYDTRRFLQRHGCDGIVAKKMIRQINTMFGGAAASPVQNQ